MSKFVSAVTRVTAKAKSAWASILTAGMLSAVAAKPALADLPTVEGPTSSGTGTGLMGTLSGHVQDGLVLGGLVLCGFAFFKVAEAGLVTFGEVRNDRASWTKFGSIVVVGVVMLVAVIWLLGKSAEVIA
ncbi:MULTISPECIES: TIGR03745 family integrating conjugative element membrane protein [unclassified Pantoea]|uniref:TIGR03745 family integrating conjugative element membrane protein n=1 Tax=unclassified Pantoea TaxID=2630326 RepID=UPI001CD6C466|nr:MULTISPECIES: TIGR03745 family integrating conjugative element membrane protein [unclassified Pantoea]MCA1179527.1 TIGR03745 family integrating conjugative element membrane protein [Pantoea sp. alder69]MCA1251780.1 TIGR03745 family integrating conjugative element membrane protein [Pantoea sp. alder70]MCA1267883.1 TIGR03745 family integrating conjugative element membrane protein [Pantoea sp. alder81]